MIHNNSVVRKTKNIIRRLKIISCMKFPFGRKIYVIGTPEHVNTGDGAVAIAQKIFLNDIGYASARVKDIGKNEYLRSSGLYKKLISPKSIICGIGGGNMGNLWYDHELLRYKLISDFPDNPMIIFPQTVFFSNDDKGRHALEVSKGYYNNKINLTIVARERTSYKLLKEYYPSTEVILTPDMVLYTSSEDFGVNSKKKSGVFMVFRQDKEKAVSESDKDAILNFLEKSKIEYHFGSTLNKNNIDKHERETCVKSKIQAFANAKLVITDRLHGMIFSTISGTPCIVFGNNHHKIKDSFEWISYLQYIKFANNAEEAIGYIPELLMLDNCKYDNFRLRNEYQPIFKAIKKYENKRNRSRL